MTRARWRAMYLTSCLVGYLLGSALWLAGGRWEAGLRAVVSATAREHAEQAARKEGPYLAPVTLVLILAAGTAFAVVAIRWLT